MKTVVKLLVTGLAAALLSACGPKSGRGLHVPDGDPVAGKQSFVALGCANCHAVRGVSDLPAPTATPPVPVLLGGQVPYLPNDGQLMTSIINPSHRVKFKGRVEGVASGEGSRMGDYTEVMTVRELIDILSFLHSTYEELQIQTP